MVPQVGIEPTQPAYKTGPLPLRIQGHKNGALPGSRTPLDLIKSQVHLPLCQQRINWCSPRDSNPDSVLVMKNGMLYWILVRIAFSCATITLRLH